MKNAQTLDPKNLILTIKFLYQNIYKLFFFIDFSFFIFFPIINDDIDILAVCIGDIYVNIDVLHFLILLRTFQIKV